MPVISTTVAAREQRARRRARKIGMSVRKSRGYAARQYGAQLYSLVDDNLNAIVVHEDSLEGIEERIAAFT